MPDTAADIDTDTETDADTRRPSEETEHATSRRAVLQGAAVVGLVTGTGALLAACGSTSSSAPPASGPTSASGAATSGATGTATAGSGGGGGTSGTTLGPAADVEVGGGVIYSADKVVVTQPAAGEFHGFTAVCTHQGCLVSSVADGAIVCDCHGSHYSITDGSVLSGPAPAPLAAVDVTVDGGDVILDA